MNIRITSGLLIGAISLFLPHLSNGQGSVLFLSNLAQPGAGTVAVASNGLVAQAFYPSASTVGYSLDSVQLKFDTPTGSPQGLLIAIYNGDRWPENQIGTLEGPDPSVEGVFTFTASGMTLFPQTLYWIVLTAQSPLLDGSYAWNISSTQDYDSNSGWTMGLSYQTSADGSGWILNRPNPLHFALYATPIPETSSFVLFGWGIFCLATRQFFRHGSIT